MTGFISYPRTAAEAMSLVSAAYAHCPEPLRSRLRARIARMYARFLALSGIGCEFLIANYPDPARFAEYRRGDEEGRLIPELGAHPGAMPSPPPAQFIEVEPPARTSIAEAFMGPVASAATLPTDTMVWRFIGASFEVHDRKTNAAMEKYSCSRLDGEWWGVGPLPQTEAEWRDKFAIPGHWNGDGAVERINLSELPERTRQLIAQHGLVGPVAPQPSMVPGYYLAGGGEQLWVPAGTIDIPTVRGVPPAAALERSAWNPEK